MSLNNISGCTCESEDLICAYNYFLPKTDEILDGLTCEKQLFEIGCSNSSVANHLVVNKWNNRV